MLISHAGELFYCSGGSARRAEKTLQKCGLVWFRAANGCKCQGAEQSNKSILDEVDEAVATYFASDQLELLFLFKHLGLDLADQPLPHLRHRLIEAATNIGRGSRNDPDRIQQLLGIGGGLDSL